MQITIEIPDAIAQRMTQRWEALPRKVLETLVAEAYKAEIISHAEVGRILQIPSRYEVDGFLKQAGAYLHYDVSDFEQDLLTMQRLEGEAQLKQE
jgi:predicted HTH domain antitoxin